MLLAAIAVFVLLCSGRGQVLASASFSITEMAVTTKISKGKPIDSVRRISASSVSTLYCFTRVASSSEEESLIRHRWLKDGAQVREAELPVKGKRWRTHSSIPVSRDSKGSWRVEALDPDGTLIKAVEFRIN
jgi:hypothetical protein